MPLRLPKKLPKIILVTFLSLFILQILFLIFVLLIPFMAQAQDESTIPQVNVSSPVENPSCWTQEDCESDRSQGRWALYPSADCGGEGSPWRKCFHKTDPIELAIALQGTQKVIDIADYIARIYQYVVGIGGILATVMIIFGGIVYLTAGGNPGRIGEAKEYISNALIGLVLLFTSYLLLQTINPALVRLQMPAVPMVRYAGIGEQFCLNLTAPEGYELKFASADPSSTPEDPRTFKKRGELEANQFSAIAPGGMECNKAYYEFSRPSPCFGRGCRGDNQVCLPDESKANWYTCKTCQIGGTITWQGNYFVDDITVKKVCNGMIMNTSANNVAGFLGVSRAGQNVDEEAHQYCVSDLNVAREVESCPGGAERFQGFVLLVEVNDDELLSWDTDNEFYVGTGGCVNTAVDPDKPIALQGAFPEWNWAGVDISKTTFNPTDSGIPCDLHITSTGFPDPD